MLHVGLCRQNAAAAVNVLREPHYLTGPVSFENEHMHTPRNTSSENTEAQKAAAQEQTTTEHTRTKDRETHCS